MSVVKARRSGSENNPSQSRSAKTSVATSISGSGIVSFNLVKSSDKNWSNVRPREGVVVGEEGGDREVSPPLGVVLVVYASTRMSRIHVGSSVGWFSVLLLPMLSVLKRLIVLSMLW